MTSTSDLARLIGVHAPYDGTFELRVPGVYTIRVSRMNTEITHALQRSAVCIIAQGAKSVMIGENVYGYEAGQVAVYSVDVPVAAQITRASRAEPYLNLKLDLDAQKVAELALKVYPHGLPQSHDDRALYVGEAGAPRRSFRATPCESRKARSVDIGVLSSRNAGRYG